MDHVDWMDEKYARELAAALARQVTPGGRVIWRSAALQPPYVPIIRDAGFTVRAAATVESKPAECLSGLNGLSGGNEGAHGRLARLM